MSFEIGGRYETKSGVSARILKRVEEQYSIWFVGLVWIDGVEFPHKWDLSGNSRSGNFKFNLRWPDAKDIQAKSVSGNSVW